ncbi:MAG TPA: TRAFs-binding domain-containing protein [Longimicrobium sp.]|nr:TRAFs-binding domain-containing protein [Longimicrobium sp.]
MSERPLCFVLMPFDKKKDPLAGPDIDFDRIYESAIRPAIEDAGMDAIRADEERAGGIIHKAMFERLLLCDYAVADLTTANANVLYELGVRHAARPSTTVSIFAKNHKPPFDVGPLRALPYDLGEGNRFGDDQAAALHTALSTSLKGLRELARTKAPTDSPLFELLTDYGAPDIARLKTDLFRERVAYSTQAKKNLARARVTGSPDAVAKVQEELGNLAEAEAGVVVDLYLSYRAVKAWERMIELYERMPVPLQRTVLIREQLGFALNRAGRKQEAIDVLEEVAEEHGPSSETLGLLGRVYKDLWQDAGGRGDPRADGFLNRAIDTYVRGFEADWRDAFPGINAVTLLEVRGDAASLAKKDELLPVVRFAVMQRLKGGKPDYWDHATLLELAVLASDEAEARRHLGNALAAVREPWEPESTANNLRMIRSARLKRGVDEPWLAEVIGHLHPEKPE